MGGYIVVPDATGGAWQAANVETKAGDKTMVSPEGRSIIDRAKRIYADRLQSDVERDQLNRFVSIEPESGEFFPGDTLDEAVQSAVRKYPTRRSFTIRIGHRAALHTGPVLNQTEEELSWRRAGVG